jgi:hypothetical protein
VVVNALWGALTTPSVFFYFPFYKLKKMIMGANILKSLSEKLSSSDLVSALSDNEAASIKDEVSQGVLEKFASNKGTPSEKDNLLVKEDNIVVYVNTLSESQAKSLFYNTPQDKIIAKIGESKTDEDFTFGEFSVPKNDSSPIHFRSIILRWCAEVLNLAPAVGATSQDPRYVEIENQLSKNLVCPIILDNKFLFHKMSTGLAGGALLSGKSEIGKRFWLRYQQNNGDDYFDTRDVAILLWKESNQGQEMLKTIAREFENVLISTSLQKELFKDALEAKFKKMIDIVKPNIKDIAVLLAVVGGTQELNVSLLDFKRIPNVPKIVEYESKLLVHLMDDFGVSEDDWGADFLQGIGDLLSFKLVKDKDAYRESLLAFWILQHQRGIQPFRTVISFLLDIKGKYSK